MVKNNPFAKQDHPTPSPQPSQQPSPHELPQPHSTQPMLLIEKKNGESHSFAFSFLLSCSYKPAKVVIRFTCAEITITGTSLRPLYDQLRTHTLTAIYEHTTADQFLTPTHNPTTQPPQPLPIIQKIEIMEIG